MSAEAPPKGEVAQISPDLIERNLDNPRLIFSQSEMQSLLESIEEVGILVPLTIFKQEENRYILIDGERRWQCALRLNLKTVPVNIIARPSSNVEYVLRMFNIHNVREDWKLMPTALKLKVILDEFKDKTDKELAKITGMTLSTLKRCKDLLELSKEFQQMILDEEAKEVKKPMFSEDFFLEMMGALRSIKKFHSDIFDRYTEKGVMRRFVKKRKVGKIRNETDFRKIPKIIAAGRKGVSEMKVHKTLTKLLDKTDFTIDEAYKVAVPTIESVGIEKRCSELNDSLRELDTRLSSERKRNLVKILKKLKKTIEQKLKDLE